MPNPQTLHNCIPSVSTARRACESLQEAPRLQEPLLGGYRMQLVFDDSPLLISCRHRKGPLLVAAAIRKLLWQLPQQLLWQLPSTFSGGFSGSFPGSFLGSFHGSFHCSCPAASLAR